jgi:hypothetical protein
MSGGRGTGTDHTTGMPRAAIRVMMGPGAAIGRSAAGPGAPWGEREQALVTCRHIMRHWSPQFSASAANLHRDRSEAEKARAGRLPLCVSDQSLRRLEDRLGPKEQNISFALQAYHGDELRVRRLGNSSRHET